MSTDIQTQLRRILAERLHTTTYAQLSAQTGLATSVIHHFLRSGRRLRIDSFITLAETLGYQLRLRRVKGNI